MSSVSSQLMSDCENFDEQNPTKQSTETFLKPLRKTAAPRRADCRYGIYCKRMNCSFVHPNRRSVDDSKNSSQYTECSSFIPSPSNLVMLTHQRDDSSELHTASLSHHRPSSTGTHPRVRNCHYDLQCKQLNCYFAHPNGRYIDQRSTIYDDLCQTIDHLLSIAQEQLQQSREYHSDIDDDSGMDALQSNASEEFRLQEKEFHTAIECLRMEFNSVLFSTDDLSELQRIEKQLTRELKHWQSRLPIYARRSDIINKVKNNQVFILKADTGSGKSTQTVQYLCDEHLPLQKQILCTQPRKLAVRSLAARVAEEYGCRVGEEIGFQVGGGRSITSNKTQVKFVTDTLFLHEYQKDPMLQNYSIVVVDEAHERKIDTDIVFGVMKLCLRKRKDLKLIIMSATLDMDLLYQYFVQEFRCDTLEVGGRIYPIEDTYLDEDIDNYVSASVTKAIEIHRSGASGDILVFLTGQDEIDLALNELNQKLDNDSSYVGLPLHGKLSEEENARIFERIIDRRKILFSTNVAETSVTIDGIEHVIESGMVKEKMWDEKRKMQVLKIGQITKSSVKQRRGRAGRTSPGKCYHLYTIETYEAMDVCSRAEILCTQPTIAILKLKHINIPSIESFEWLQPPSESTLREAHQTLIWLDALDSQGKLTRLGRNIARLDIDPKLAVMLYKGLELKCFPYALILAGMLTVSQNIWWTSKDQKSKEIGAQTRAEFSHESGDHLTLVNVYLKWKGVLMTNRNKKQQYEWCKNHSLSGKSLQMADEFIREKAKQMEERIDFNYLDEQLNKDLADRLLQCMTAGHFLNLAVSNGPLRAGYQIISPFSSTSNEPVIARVFRTSTLCLNDQMPKYILFNELVNLNEINYITILSSIDLHWLTTVSQQWYTTVNVAHLHTIAYESYTFENIGATLLRAVVGKRNCQLSTLEELTQAMIDVDYQRAKLTVWTRAVNLERGKKLVEEMIVAEKQKLLVEAEEMQIVGRTRILMGAGGISQMILVKDEFIRIIITKLPTTITEERVRHLCQPFGEVRRVHFLRQNASGACVVVTYTTISEARTALAELNGRMEGNREISVSSSCLKTDVIAAKQCCRLKAIWHLTRSTGNAKIVFSQEESALEASRLFKRHYFQCHYERSTSVPTLKLVYYLGEHTGKAFVYFETLEQAQNAVGRMSSPMSITMAKNSHHGAGAVLFQGFQKDFDDEDVRDHFQGCRGLLNVQVLRGRRNQRFQKPESAEEDIQTLFSVYESFQSETVIINPNIINGKLEAFVEFLDIKDLQDAIDDLSGRTELIGCGKVRLSERIQPKQQDTKKKRENEYIIKLQRLNQSLDRYDLIKLMKDNQLYDHVKHVTVFRQKLDKDNYSSKHLFTLSEDQEIGLFRLQSMLFDGKDLFQSEPNCQISSCTPDGTVTAIVLFDDPVDVLTAAQTFDNRDFQLHPEQSKLRLIPSISHEIFINAALTAAIPEKIQQVIEHIRQRFRRVYIKVVPTRTATMKIIISGDDVQQITMAKIQFDHLIKGIEYKYDDDPENTSLLFDRNGTNALQRIERETGSYIWWDYSKSFVRIYGTDQATDRTKERIDRYIRETLKNKKHSATLDIPPSCVRQVLKTSQTYQNIMERNFHVQIKILVAERQIRIEGKEENVANCAQTIQADWLTMVTEQRTSFTQTTSECPICYNPTNYSLQACGHAYCLDCLKHQLSTKFDTTLSCESLRITCLMPQCDAVLLLRDIKTIIDPVNMPKLARASFQAYLKMDANITQCPGIDCNQVYRKSKYSQAYVCESCLKMYCIKCEVEYHLGLTCETYQTLLKWKEEEAPTMINIGDLGFKPCPSCKQVIDRYEGCNAVKCKCGVSFCWRCLKSDPQDIHSHFMDVTSPCYRKMIE